jgi:hypothetical protein
MQESAAITEGRGGAPFRRVVLIAAVSAALALGAAACGGAPGNPAASSTSGTARNAGTGSGAGQGSGPVSVRGGSASGTSGQRSTGTSFSLAFARCMRAHGVPKFPDPNSSAAQLGPGSGVNPASSTFQAALNGSCRALAPPPWVSSGQVSGGS